MSGAELNRRTVLGAAAAGAALAVAGPAAACHPRGARPVFVAGAGVPAAQARRLAHASGAVLARLDGAVDPVRFWSRTVAPMASSGAPVLGLTDWSDYLVVKGMAAEARLRGRYEIGQDGEMHRFAQERDGRLEALAGRLQAEIATGAAPGTAILGWILA